MAAKKLPSVLLQFCSRSTAARTTVLLLPMTSSRITNRPKELLQKLTCNDGRCPE